jgi:hypothetical protein
MPICICILIMQSFKLAIYILERYIHTRFCGQGNKQGKYFVMRRVSSAIKSSLETFMASSISKMGPKPV